VGFPVKDVMKTVLRVFAMRPLKARLAPATIRKPQASQDLRETDITLLHPACYPFP